MRSTKCSWRWHHGPSRRDRSGSIFSGATKLPSRAASRSATALLPRAECCSMIDWLVGFAWQKRLVMALITLLLSLYGVYSWTQLALDAYPDIADTSSRVITQAPGRGAEEVEQLMTSRPVD